jgi:cytochrome P450
MGGLPFLRSSLQFARDPIALFVEAKKIFGPAFRFQAFDFNLTVMLGAQAHRAIFIEHADKLSARLGYSLLLGLMDDALLVSDGAHHAMQRRLMQPGFHSKRLEGYLDLMREVTLRQMAQWRDGDVIDIYAQARRITLEIVVRALMGVDIRNDYDDMADTITHTFDYVTQPAMRKLFKINLPFHPYGRSLRARKRLDELIYGLIHEKREILQRITLQAHTASQGDLLSWLIEAQDAETGGTRFNDDSIRDQVLLMIYAGHDTATCSVAWALYLLAKHPHVVAKLDAERARVLNGREIEMSDMKSLPYLDCVLDETLRLYPAVWIGMRGVTHDFEFDGKRIAAGSRVMYSPGASHRLPEVFANPNAFEPERFSPENKAKIPPFAYVPFGGGVRTCIGMPFANVELRVMLTEILARWDFELVNDKPIAMHYNPTLAPSHRGIHLRLRAKV